MKCQVCGTDTEKVLLPNMTHWDGGFIMIRNTPCCRCPQCSEVFDSADFTHIPEAAIQNAKKLKQESYLIEFPVAARAVQAQQQNSPFRLTFPDFPPPALLFC